MSSERSRSGGRRNRHYVEPEEQILAEGALLDGEAQVLVGRRDDADIALDRRPTADGRVFALLQDAQEAGLRLHRHVADFVEKQRPAFGLLEAANRPRGGAGEGALLMPEQFAFDEVARDRGHVDRDEWAALALAVIVQRPRDQLLAGPGFAGNHHAQVGLHQTREHPKNVLHGGRAADDRHRLGRRVVVRLLAPALGLGERPPDDSDQFAQVEWLWQVLVSATLGGLDRGHERVLGAHDDDRQVGPHPLDAREQIEGVVVRHHDVGDHEVAFARRHPAPQPGDRAGRAHLVAGPGQRLVQYGANPSIVVGDQYLP